MNFSSCIALGLSLARADSLNPELRAVSLSLREKQSLYHSLGQLLRSGVPLPGALQNLAQTSRGAQRRLIRRLNEAINARQDDRAKPSPRSVRR